MFRILPKLDVLKIAGFIPENRRIPAGVLPDSDRSIAKVLSKPNRHYVFAQTTPPPAGILPKCFRSIAEVRPKFKSGRNVAGVEK
uniref:Uncharacterized protein n=1 Tax=Caenorhabditis japonica TaxID=281687 RepID=A0A8R1EEX8_CAEJA